MRLCFLEEPFYDLSCRQHIVDDSSQEHIVLLGVRVEWQQEHLVIQTSVLHDHVSDSRTHLQHEFLWIVFDIYC